jgi:ankyrin repeat protein
MKKLFAWLLFLSFAFCALFLFSLVPTITKHIYTSDGNSSKDAFFSLLVGGWVGVLFYSVALLWRFTKKSRTGKDYVEVKVLTQKNIGKLGCTELMVLSSQGDAPKILSLLAKGEDINRKDSKGNTALIYALMNSKTNVVELLVQMGADVKLQTNSGQDAIWYADNLGLQEITKLF